MNKNAAESLADPEEYPNLFEDWQVALAIETKISEKRYSCAFVSLYFSFHYPFGKVIIGFL